MSGISCDVCHNDSYKYRCSACKAPSCSLTCFKSHQAGCDVEEDESGTSQIEPVTNASSHTRQPVPNEVDLEKLEALFNKYPDLRSQLNAIYCSTLDPTKQSLGQDQTSSNPNNTQKSNNGRDLDRNWNPEKGFRRGLQVLRSKAETEGRTSFALEEFMTLLRTEDHLL